VDHLQKFVAQLQNRVAILLMLNSISIIGGYWLMAYYVGPNLHFKNQQIATVIILVFIAFLSVIALAWLASTYLTKPIRLVWQAVLHISPSTANYPAPDTKNIGFGQELVTALVSHVYQLASVVDDVERTAQTRRHDLKTDFVANSLPMPVVVLDKDTNIIFANDALLKTVGRTAGETFGQNVYLILDLLFTNEDTFDGVSGSTETLPARHQVVARSGTPARSGSIGMGIAGSDMRKVLPAPTLEETVSRPRCASTISRAM
jgi:PAS domain-containing protein